MPALTQNDDLGDLLKYEAPNLYSRAVGTVAAGQDLALGTVLGRDSVTSKLEALDPAAVDGTEIAVGVLALEVDATLADRPDAILIVRHAIVARSALVWPGGITDAQKATAEEQLAALGVLVRDSA